MCFASSIVEAHKKLFIAAPATAAAASVHDANAAAGAISSSSRNSCSSSSGANATVAATTDKKERKSTASTAKMSARSKSRLQTEVCGDCGNTDPAWASINRGILLCSDCCSVHRSLGRHISMVKSLRQGTWEPSVLNFVNSLNAHGANSVWEHHLLDGTTAPGSGGGGAKGAPRLRKPTPKDALHPAKSDFIKAKHVQLAFVLKPNLQDAADEELIGGSLEHELSKQLHASVRTSNLETSLRLLVQGADPNFFHEEKRSTPLHVAAKFGQASQIELLLVYGAEINAIDGNGLTPLEVAKSNNHNMIAERLLDAMYDVTDRIIMFLGGKKPDHASGRHLVIPEAVNHADISEQLKIARGRLQLVPNKMFEELVMDLYDEVDRRENEAIWATSTVNGENVAVPFLPANPFLSATRNQGRQKLARFSRAEFAGLLTDVLIDARRRQNMANLRPLDATSSAYYNPTNNNNTSNNTTSSSLFNTSNNEHDPNLSDDEPIYDPVASDDDYAPVPPIAQQAVVHQSAKAPPSSQQESHLEVNALRKQISEYVSKINQLETVVQKLSSENSELKSKFSNNNNSNSSVYDEPLRIDLNGSECDDDHEPLSLPCDAASNAGGSSASATAAAGGGSNSASSSSASSSANNSNQSTIKRPASMYERRPVAPSFGGKANAENRTTTSMYQMPAGAANDKQTPPGLGEEVKHRTDVVTRRLKELIMAMQDAANKETLVPCAERIRVAVMELIAVFTTPSNCSEVIRETLKQLTRYNILIQHECENLQQSYSCELDKTTVDKYIKEVRDCAYYIASATKTLVMQFE